MNLTATIILFWCLGVPAAQAITTTYNESTLEWDVTPVTNMVDNDPGGTPYPGGAHFNYVANQLSPFFGNELHVTIAAPALEFDNPPGISWGRSISVVDNLGREWSVTQSRVAGVKSYPALVLSKTILVYPTNAVPNAARFDFALSTTSPNSNITIVFEMRKYAYGIDKDPGGKGDPEDQPDTEYDPPPACATHGVPTYSVNTSNLNLVVQDTEFGVQSLGPKLATTRTWNTDPSQAGMFGNGWSFLYESTVQKFCGGARLMVGSGKGLIYYTSFTDDLCPASGQITYPVSTVPPEGVFDKLTYQSGDYWLLEKKDSRQTHRYDPAGGDRYRLTSITDKNGNALLLLYANDGTISSVKDAAGRQLSFIYDSRKRAIAMCTPDGRQATFGYDTPGNLIRTVDLYGTEILYQYDADNFMSAMSYAGKTISYSYDSSGGWKHVASVVDANGNTRRYVGLSVGQTASSVGRTEVTDPVGGVTSYSSTQGRTTGVSDPLGHTFSQTFANGLPISITDRNNNRIAKVYDSRGNLTQITNALGKITTHTYDSSDNLVSQTNPLGEKWTYLYDGRNNVTSVTSPANKVSTLTYDAKGKLTAVTDANGHTSTFTHDSFGNRKTRTDPLGQTTTFGYDSAGINRISALDPNGNASSFAYDQNRRLTRITHADGSHRDFRYDGCAMTGVSDENGNSRSFSRDKMLRITGIADAMNALSTNTYDRNGNLVAQTDPLQKSVALTYDAANRLTTLTNPVGGSVMFTLDAHGNATTVRDERLKQTLFWFDANNRVYATTDPLGRVVNVLRDDLGRIKQLNSARGGIIRYTFDSEERLTAKTYGAATAATYSYDSAGNLISFTDTGGTTTYTYNARNEITGISYPDLKSVTFAYDNAGNIVTANYPGGLALTYGVSNRNRIQTMQWDTSSVSFSYDASGNLLSETRSNGTSADYMYNANNRLTSIRHKNGAGTIASMDYVRNAAGYIVNESITLPVALSLTNSSATGVYDNANQISSFGGSTYSYDADGNLSGISGSRTFTASYDPENRPVQMTSGGVTANYRYDGLGNRTQAVRGAQTTKYYYDHRGRLLFEADGSSTIVNYYLYQGERLVAMRSAAGGSFFYHYDKTGNTVAITNGSGNTVNTYSYAPYGGIAASSEIVANQFKYVGAFGVMDEGNDLYFMKNRYYDAVTGRFIQRDPIGFAGGQMNLYAYVGNNPVGNVDPEGTEGIPDGTADVSAPSKGGDKSDGNYGDPVANGVLESGKDSCEQLQKSMSDLQKLLEMLSNLIKSMHDMQKTPVINLRG